MTDFSLYDVFFLGSLWATLVYGFACSKASREARALIPCPNHPLASSLCVIIPARNEAERLPSTLAGLQRIAHPELRVFVVDDSSTDDTAALVRKMGERDPRFFLIEGPDEAAPAGKAGKSLALHHAWQEVQKRSPSEELPWILFMDADVVIEEDRLGAVLELAQTQMADALSGMPKVSCERWIEKLMVPAGVALAGAHHPPSKVQDPSTKAAFLNGQFILIRREALDAVGGHLAVAEDILEDVALARRLKAAGKKLVLVDLRPFVHTRMYTGWSEILDGFGKNVVPLVGGTLRAMAFGIFGVSLAWTAPITAGLGAVFFGAQAFPLFILWVVVLALQARIRQIGEWPVWPALLSPLTALGMGWLIFRAIWIRRQGGAISWRDRQVRPG